MMLAINLPGQAIDALREVWGDRFEEKAFEALIIQGYRERVFSVGKVATLVGLGTSIEAEQWLADRGVERNIEPVDLDLDTSLLGTLNTPPLK
jgi:predicted HTH domain antitoxin